MKESKKDKSNFTLPEKWRQYRKTWRI